MLELTLEQEQFIKDNFEQKEVDKMFNTDDLDDILLPLDALITYQGFDEEYMLNNWGSKAQKIYDDIYAQNKK